MSQQISMPLTILDKEYRVLCRLEESDSLNLSAIYLDKKMRDIRNNGKVVGLERIAVMAALNITHDYLSSKTNKQDYIEAVREHLQMLLNKIENAIAIEQPECAEKKA